ARASGLSKRTARTMTPDVRADHGAEDRAGSDGRIEVRLLHEDERRGVPSVKEQHGNARPDHAPDECRETDRDHLACRPTPSSGFEHDDREAGQEPEHEEEAV